MLSALAGTAVMTLSSALMSLKGQEFREPKHLRGLLRKLLPFVSKSTGTAGGWLAHYSMGCLFCLLYVTLWEKYKIKPSMLNGIILGCLSSLIGICIWKATFSIHPLSPLMNYRRFYLQRIPAHLIFAVSATISYQMLKKHNKSIQIASHE